VDAGLWINSQIAPLRQIVDFSHTQGEKVGIELAHAGRKASTLALPLQWSAYRPRHVDTSAAYVNENGWPDNGIFFFLIARTALLSFV
jgi:2,4-dienoyl-CoA reductase-like NADH-dependent reductase (Old Yellow Enzyme family)